MSAPNPDDRARELLAKVNIQSAAELRLKKIPPPRWTVEGLLPEGLALLSAPPKSGKSFIGLSLAVAVASGGQAFGRLAVSMGRALFLGLEDSDRRLQGRLERLGGGFPVGLDIISEIPRGVALGALLDAWASSNPDARLIVLDTLGRAFRGVDFMDYSAITAAFDPIQRLAFNHGISILCLHHTRKGLPEGDVFDSSLGTQATFGAMDSSFLMQRKRGETTAILHTCGREIGDASFSLELEAATMQWRMTDRPPEETLQGPERRAILEILRKAGPEGARTSEIASTLGRAASTVSTLLKKLQDEGLCTSPKYGHWKPSESIESVESPKPSKAIESEPTFYTFDTFDRETGEAPPSGRAERSGKENALQLF